MNELIAYCGLDCETCDARIATLNNDEGMREKTAKLWSKLNAAEITAKIPVTALRPQVHMESADNVQHKVINGIIEGKWI